MKKFNKKGFTLIEMLVVIAIIAVLVSIIIPTVSSATTKAQAATDAANLRSMLAEATTDYLNGKTETEGLVHFTAPSTFAAAPTAPKSKSVNGATSGSKAEATITVDGNGVFTAKYGDYTLEMFAYVAENGGSLDDAKTKLTTPASGESGKTE